MEATEVQCSRQWRKKTSQKSSKYAGKISNLTELRQQRPGLCDVSSSGSVTSKKT